MEAYLDVNPLWDLPQRPALSQLPEDDFLTLLQKQFPSTNSNLQSASEAFLGINLNSHRQSLPTLTPPSEDSSPSPPLTTNGSSHSRQQSKKLTVNATGTTDHEDHSDYLKRKAVEDDLEDEPNPKSQHLGNKKTGPNIRRKSGDGGPDERRLLKRKEQNRAAQRAFRERKEKHVKDLEDKVAALEAKNDEAQSENDNLRDLLGRLQTENLMLKQSSFSFQVPKQPDSGVQTAVASSSHPSPLVPENSSGSSPKAYADDGIDWNSLTAFDPAMLNLLDDNSHQNNMDESMSVDFSNFDSGSFTTLVSNPSFMSFANTFDPVTPAPGTFSFDLQPLAPWQMSSDSESFLNSQTFSPMTSISSNSASGGSNSLPTPVTSPSDSPSSLFGHNSESQVVESVDECPKTRAEAAQLIAQQGPSPFAPEGPPLDLYKRMDAQKGASISCVGSLFPKTEKSDKNVEVLSAWRTITSNPKFKDVDINELCSEFSKKARCDGSKVVLEPAGVNHILESISKHKDSEAQKR